MRADQGYRGADFHAWVQEATGITKDYEHLRVCSQNAVYLTMAMFLVRCLARSAR
ncbi:hypothetical protein [Streptomyces triticiradicis]|uniref:hypothetical protein n=1 Tax=Streptomyces triticiradicis TaxID=2651189 RepID=UPI001788B7C7|nr:hypothetical protein [Streptomyces triticiradicis]